ncbi:MAG TPA: AMP-binding protein [Acidimicrobiales bacterium]|nr:AMP-binding protein [Acidimicrobiales bacterium]
MERGTAAALAAAGVRPGDRVAVCVHKSPDALVAYLACLRAGAVFLPLNPAHTERNVPATASSSATA